MSQRLTRLGLPALILSASIAGADTPSTEPAGPSGADSAAPETAVTLAGTESWHLTNAQGRPYHIMVSKPQGEVPYTGGYPVVYVLDGNAYFPAFHAAKQTQAALQKAIVVGIGYPDEQALNFLRRSYDFSPPAPADQNEPPQGGQDELLDFIEQQLMPAVAERYPVDPHQQSLFGHSFGGMFAVYALFQRPALFDHVVAVSPSLWWRDRYLLAPEQRFRQQVEQGNVSVTHTSLALVMAEGDSAQEIQDAQALALRLGPLSGHGLRSSVRIEPGEDHMSVPYRVVSRVLTDLLSARRQ